MLEAFKVVIVSEIHRAVDGISSSTFVFGGVSRIGELSV